MSTGATSDPTASAGGTSTQGGIFNNPLAAPILYNSMLGASMPQGQSNASSGATNNGAINNGAINPGLTQLGMMMMLANQQNGGIGPGRLSGTRGAPRQRDSAGTQPAGNAKLRSSDRPGGLASRYFNRTGGHSAYPRSFFNRRPSYFP
jgi:hypothetical protein